MSNIIYISEREFVICDALVSHGQFLLRSQKNSEYNFNIDIIFFALNYIQISSMLRGLTIRISNGNTNALNYTAVNKYLSYKNNHLFEIESEGEVYFIAASFIKVFENELEFNETSLGFDNKGKDKLIASSM